MDIKVIEAGIRSNCVNGVYAHNINLSGFKLKELPDLSDITVSGYFDCSNNKLKSLKGSPKVVGTVYFCDGNPLKSLEGVSEEIGDWFIIDKKIWDRLPKDSETVLRIMLNNKITLA